MTKRFRSFMIEDILGKEHQQSTLKSFNTSSLNLTFKNSNKRVSALLNETQTHEQFEQRLDRCLARVRGDLNGLVSDSDNSDDNECEDEEIDVLNTSQDGFVSNSTNKGIEINSVSNELLSTNNCGWSDAAIARQNSVVNMFNQGQFATAINLSTAGSDVMRSLHQPTTISSTLPLISTQQPEQHKCIRHSANSSGSTSFSLVSTEDDDDNVFIQPNCEEFSQSIVQTSNSSANYRQTIESKPVLTFTSDNTTAALPSADMYAQLIATNSYIRMFENWRNTGAQPCQNTPYLLQQLLIKRKMQLQAKPRKGGQIRFNQRQTSHLERLFANQKYLMSTDRRVVATRLGLSERQVKTWFQNRRAKWRKLKHQHS